ncbi:tyrosine-type recombinase/integrase [[Mycobacterium] kokjensenii]|uniref:Tyrosine-type recombinase/integrase n=1 Tax=[Mycobacterium] kokjensenii TaxID=3064287 RepID=A0ABN9N279_9MYCO|nr:tyrosine-type recombinase/integrase [Mycolicibacter sp. MU0083]
MATRKAGLDDIGVRTLRHGVAVALLESGVHIKAVADILGHSSVAITREIYGHTSDAAARTAIDGLSSRIRIASL